MSGGGPPKCCGGSRLPGSWRFGPGLGGWGQEQLSAKGLGWEPPASTGVGVRRSPAGPLSRAGGRTCLSPWSQGTHILRRLMQTSFPEDPRRATRGRWWGWADLFSPHCAHRRRHETSLRGLPSRVDWGIPSEETLMASYSPLVVPVRTEATPHARGAASTPRGSLRTRPGPVPRARSPAEHTTLPLASDQQLCLKAEPSASLPGAFKTKFKFNLQKTTWLLFLPKFTYNFLREAPCCQGDRGQDLRGLEGKEQRPQQAHEAGAQGSSCLRKGPAHHSP